MSFSISCHRRVCHCCFVVLSLPAIVGCGGDEDPVGSVTGKVTYRGNAVQEGNVSFRAQGAGIVASGQLQPDGTYQLLFGGTPYVPAGEYAVVITPPSYLVDPEKPHPQRKAQPNIPRQYRKDSTSPFKVAVKEGENTLDFEMQ